MERITERTVAGRTTVGNLEPAPGWLLNLDRMDYAEACRIQSALAARRQASEIPDALILLEHPPVLTLGRRGNEHNVLVPPETLEGLGIVVHATDRGGDVTYHGPGQLVGYPIVSLKRYGQDVRRYVQGLEEVMISVLAEYGLEAGRRPGFPGVWVGEAKIGFLGVHVSHWVTRHGFSLNVQPDLSHFALIRPCGLEGVHITSMAVLLGRRLDMDEVRRRTAAAFGRVFGLDLQAVRLEARL